MNFFNKSWILLFFFGSILLFGQNYVTIKDGIFSYKGKPYYFVGTNYWYGSFLGLENNPEKGIDRLRRELDFLKQQGISNLRVLVGVEGTGKINGVNRVEPPYQYEAGKFDENSLKGLDIFLDEIAKRDMKAVLFLSNNWEWSGGWLQYLRWNNQIEEETFRRVMNWDELRDETSKFYSCYPCISEYHTQIRNVLTRKNSVNGKKYKKDNSIMAWEIANEPRPMRPAAISDFQKFISETASLIKSIDKKHLLTTGSEGEMGSESMAVFKMVHRDRNIDYLTIHIWPKNWGWIDVQKMDSTAVGATSKTLDYIRKHQLAADLNKPLVLEEFGLPRDHHSFDIRSSTLLRDQYYDAVFQLWDESRKSKGAFSGIAFWAFGGEARPIPGQTYWKKGDDYMGDPPMEEQGLNSVFDADVSTWDVIRKYSNKAE